MLGLKHWSKIIDSAARSPSGIVALAILAISCIIGTLFSNSDQSGTTRLIAFSGAVGAILILAVLVVVNSASRSAPTTHEHLSQYHIIGMIATTGIIVLLVSVIWVFFYLALIVGFAPGGWQFFQSTPSIGLRDLAIYNTVILIPLMLMFGAFFAISTIILKAILKAIFLHDPPGEPPSAATVSLVIFVVSILPLFYYGARFFVAIAVSVGNLALYGDERVILVNETHISLTYCAITSLAWPLFFALLNDD